MQKDWDTIRILGIYLRTTLRIYSFMRRSPRARRAATATAARCIKARVSLVSGFFGQISKIRVASLGSPRLY